MKTLSTLIIFCFLTLSYFSQEGVNPESPSTNTLNLRDSVKSIEERSFKGILENGLYIAVEPKWETSWERDSKSMFDPSGHLVKKIIYGDSITESRVDYYIFEKDLLIESKVHNIHRLYEYDSIGRVLQEIYKSTGPTLIGEQNNNHINKSSYNKINYYYEKNVTVKIAIDAEGTTQKIDSIFYNEKDDQIRIHSYNSSNIDYQIMDYDDEGKLILHIWADSNDGLLERTKYEYSDGQISFEEWELFNNNKPEGKILYKYERGNVISTLERDSDGTTAFITDYIYEFDSKGNWIRKIIIDDKADIYIITREIEYY